MSKEFGENLKVLMDREKISVSQLAKNIGVPFKTVQEWIGKNGRIPRDLTAISKLANYFRVTTHYLLYGEEDPNAPISRILESAELHTGIYEISIKKIHKKLDS